MSEPMRDALEQARKKLLEQQEVIARLTGLPLIFGTIAWTKEKSLAVTVGDKLVEVEYPRGAKKEEFIPGAMVRLNAETYAIVDLGGKSVLGNVYTVRRLIDSRVAEIDVGGTPRTVLFSGKVVEGDRVVVDSTTTVVIANLGKLEDEFNLVEETNVGWDDIGGLAEAKSTMIEAVEMPHKHKALYERFKKKPLKGVLMYGPPGCGKTMLAKATATALAKLHGQKQSTGFIYVKGPELLNMYVGNTEASIRRLFQRSRDHEKKHGYPAVMFIDEADSMLGKRGTGRSSDMEKTIVPMFLAEMDGLEKSGALVILATNRPDTLDSAVVRDGRIDRKVHVDRPTQADTKAIFGLHLRGKPLAENLALGDVAGGAANIVFSPSTTVPKVKHRSSGHEIDIPLKHLVNGAMIAGIVDQATTIALHRELREGKQSGVCMDDLVSATRLVANSHAKLDLDEEIEAFVNRDNGKGAHATAQ